MRWEHRQVIEQTLNALMQQISSPALYRQAGLILLAVMLAWIFSRILVRNLPLLRAQPSQSGAWQLLRQAVYRSRDLLFSFFSMLLLVISIDISELLYQQSWLCRLSAGLAVVIMVYILIRRFVTNPLLQIMIKLILLPIALLQVFGGLDDVIAYLDAKVFELGNISISAYAVARAIIFGILLFWMGKTFNTLGQDLIRQQQNLTVGTREIFAKVYQVLLFFIICLLMLQIIGINITALAVFGGAVGVGLGFGLQSIASNFISGIILLIDRSLLIGDYIEMEDGRQGTVRQMNMRYTLLETYDGKEQMVPNEKFITTAFTNWTHTNPSQRYSLELSVAPETDLPVLFDQLRQVVASHPKVLSGPEIPLEQQPDAEIKSFSEAGITVLIEFWMEGIDDGRHRVGGDLLLMIWELLRQQQIELSYPKRDIRIVRDGAAGSGG